MASIISPCSFAFTSIIRSIIFNIYKELECSSCSRLFTCSCRVYIDHLSMTNFSMAYAQVWLCYLKYQLLTNAVDEDTLMSVALSPLNGENVVFPAQIFGN